MDFLDLAVLFGGLGLFLYGIKLMTGGLEAAAGDRLRGGLKSLTRNRFSAVAFGTGITAVIQSSGATTVILIGFVDAGLLTLEQAFFVGMGANIGTTITAQLIAFNFIRLAPLILFAGVILIFFIKKKRVQLIGQIIGGLGILLVGMSMMSQAVIPLKEWPPFLNMLSSFSNPLNGFLAGLLVTLVIQSSSATMGIMQAFALQGIVGLDAAVYVILGLNVGTCIMPILASMGSGNTARRTAVAFLFYNLVGAGVFALLLPVLPVTRWVESWSPGDVVRQIANFHTFFNIASAVLFIGFPQILIWMSGKVVRDSGVTKNNRAKINKNARLFRRCLKADKLLFLFNLQYVYNRFIKDSLSFFGESSVLLDLLR
ncbi:MAG: Na/Pi symporter [Eubacteriales bacterium]